MWQCSQFDFVYKQDIFVVYMIVGYFEQVEYMNIYCKVVGYMFVESNFVDCMLQLDYCMFEFEQIVVGNFGSNFVDYSQQNQEDLLYFEVVDVFGEQKYFI